MLEPEDTRGGPRCGRCERSLAPHATIDWCRLGPQKLDEEQLEELREAFSLFDTDGSGEFMHAGRAGGGAGLPSTEPVRADCPSLAVALARSAPAGLAHAAPPRPEALCAHVP